MGVDARMYFVVEGQPTGAQMREWHYRLGQAFHEHLWAYHGNDGNEVPERLFVTKHREIGQDGPTLKAPAGHWLVEVHLAGRYYGVGYERGDYPTIKAIAEFIEVMAPGSRILYGGDSSGVVAEFFGPAERAALWKHYVDNVNAPYHGMFGAMLNPDDQPPSCPWCEVPTSQRGFGNEYFMSTCLGCGWKYIRRGGEVKSGWRVADGELI